jgi:hypothetical protein
MRAAMLEGRSHLLNGRVLTTLGTIPSLMAAVVIEYMNRLERSCTVSVSVKCLYRPLLACPMAVHVLSV